MNATAMNNKRLIELDIIRSMAIIFIVFCHLPSYVDMGPFQYIVVPISILLAYIGLGFFFFASGFILYKKYGKLASKGDLFIFYKNRLLRIYPIYIFALFAHSIYMLRIREIPIPRDIVFHSLSISLLGLQGVIRQETDYILLWFIGVIFIFYFIYPFIVSSDSILGILTRSFITIIIFILLRLIFDFMTENVFIYYSIFISGIVACVLNVKSEGWEIQFNKQYRKICILILSLLMVVIISRYYFSMHLFLNSSFKFSVFVASFSLIAIFGCFTMYSIISRHKYIFKDGALNLILKISFSSYAIYLFHELILSIILVVLKSIGINSYYSNIFIIATVPFIFVIGYYIQKYNNKFMQILKSRLEHNTVSREAEKC